MRPGLLVAFSLTCALAQDAPPTFLEFSARFLGPTSNTGGSTRIATGPSGEFYVAGIAGARPQTIGSFAKQPVNQFDSASNFSQVSFVARFSPAGELLDWRLLGTPQIYGTIALRTDVPGRVALVLSGTLLAEPATEGAWLTRASNGRSLLVLSSDLREVLVSTLLTPGNSSINDAVLDSDGSLVYTGSSNTTFANEGVVGTSLQSNAAYLARMSADGKQLVMVKPLLSEALGGRAATRLALSPDGGVWLGASAANANLVQTGSLGRPFGGLNTATWDPVSQQWTTALRPELTRSELTVTAYGYPSRPGQFLASDGISLFRSDDAGATWQSIPGYPGGTLVTCPSDPNRLYSWQNLRVAISEDQGATWTNLPEPQTNFATIRQLTVAVDNADVLALRPNSGSFSLFSKDGAKTWTPIGDPSGVQAGGVSVAAEGGAEPRLLLLESSAGIQANSGSGGWQQLGPPPAAAFSGSRPRYYPGSPAVIAFEAGGAGITADYGATWQQLPGCTLFTVCQLWVNPGASNEWWLTGTGVSRSIDRGQTWTVIRESIAPVQIASLAFSGTGEQPILALNQPTTDIYLRKLDPNWERIDQSFYLGGSHGDQLSALSVDSAGRLNVVATTTSADYPVTSDALQATADGSAIALTRLASAGDALEYSTVWGGASPAVNQPVQAQAFGDRIVWCGSTIGANQPNLTTPVAEPFGPGTINAFSGGFDAATGQWLPTFLLGGKSITNGHACAYLGDGRFLLAGQTTEANFPVTTQAYAIPPTGLGIESFSMFLSILRAQ